MAAGESDNPVTFDQLKGIKQLRRVAALLSSLHKAGCDRDKAGNRELHFDDYVLLILLYFFNPMLDSMRMLQGELKGTRAIIYCPSRVPFSSPFSGSL